MIEEAKSFFGNGAVKDSEGGLPRHIAVVTKGKHEFAAKNSLGLEGIYQHSCSLIDTIAQAAFAVKIPVITFYLLSDKRDNLDFEVVIGALTAYFRLLSDAGFIHEQRIKITVIGKWYDLPERMVEAVKLCLEKTKDYTGFCLNFCLNYNGRSEIVDAVNLLLLQAKAQKVETVTKELIKENIYSSSFPPPDLFIISGPKVISDLLLWDAPSAKIYFSGRLWPEFRKEDLMLALASFQQR
ncbi:di-trans,poly-cis-decaprenylcistransferase [Candidatus Woesearchaeota archaeon]|nr:di-trans,poly-cis-decaprenylcistransferase [Candidatus Woesearchaeota archaeon]